MQKNLEKIMRGTHDVLPQGELEKKIAQGKKLIVKLGVDPTAPNLHLGHSIVLSKLKDLQELGHHVILLIGDFTARIGDPTGRSKTRPPLTEDDIAKNTKTYLDQVGKIINLKKATIRYNSEWFDKFSSRQWIELCSKTTLARITERDDFEKRIKGNISIGFHELLYPLLQGYDSVVLKADIELGGTDQTFNMLMGRFLQQQYNQEPQIVITLPILEGLDGIAKMSKSLKNTIDLLEEPEEVFGKIMSISDQLMWRYYNLLLHHSEKQIEQMKDDIENSISHPKDLKKALAYKIIEKIWNKDDAEKGAKIFHDLFERKDHSSGKIVKLPTNIDDNLWIVDLLKLLGAVKSSSEARRLIEANAVTIDEKKISDFKAQIKTKSGLTIKVGKHRFYKLK